MRLLVILIMIMTSFTRRLVASSGQSPAPEIKGEISAKHVYIYIYIYIERERDIDIYRERERD